LASFAAPLSPRSWRSCLRWRAASRPWIFSRPRPCPCIDLVHVCGLRRRRRRLRRHRVADGPPHEPLPARQSEFRDQEHADGGGRGERELHLQFGAPTAICIALSRGNVLLAQSARVEIRLQNQRAQRNLQGPGNFACKDKDVRRERPQITMNIKRRTRAEIMGRGTLLARGCRSWSRRDTSDKTKPGAVSRPGTPTQFQFRE
jgi:hypothetical protein